MEEKANDESFVQLVDEIEQLVLGSQSSSRVLTEELHVPPPPPAIHLEVSSAPEKVIQYFTFTMFENHAESQSNEPYVAWYKSCVDGVMVALLLSWQLGLGSILS